MGSIQCQFYKFQFYKLFLNSEISLNVFKFFLCLLGPKPQSDRAGLLSWRVGSRSKVEPQSRAGFRMRASAGSNSKSHSTLALDWHFVRARHWWHSFKVILGHFPSLFPKKNAGSDFRARRKPWICLILEELWVVSYQWNEEDEHNMNLILIF